MTAVYTTVQNVLAYLQRGTTTTTPTTATITKFIEWSQGEIERKTNQAFQALTETDEIHSMKKAGTWRHRYNLINKPYVKLTKHSIKTFTSGTDYIYVRTANAWVDWVATKTEGLNGDYWVDYNQGIIHFMKAYPLVVYPDNVKVTYRWGEATVPAWAEELCTLMAAKRVLEFDYDRVISAEGGSGDEADLPRADVRIQSLTEEINTRLDENRWLNRRKKFVIN